MKKINATYIYFTIAVISSLILIINIKVENLDQSNFGEYYYSTLLRTSYNFIAVCLFFLLGLTFGLLFRVKSFIVGFSTSSIFLLATVYEMTFFRGSHNLLPFELIIYLTFSLPSIFGTELGLYLKKIKQRR